MQWHSSDDERGRSAHSRTFSVGPRALLVEVSDAEEARLLAAWIRAVELPCDEVVPAAGTVLLDGVSDLEQARDLVEGWTPDVSSVARGDLVEVPVRYDGDDLARVAEVWEVSVDEVIARHTGLEFVSSFAGFAPGFAYLSGLPSAWAVERLASPRTVVPAGSVALADTWCGVYPGASPGGWLLLGRTDVVLWDLDRPGGPALLAPGTRVRFVSA